MLSGASNAQWPAGLGAGLDGALTVLHGGEGLRCEGQEITARVSESDTAAEAVKKRLAEFFLECPDLRSHIGLHGMDFFGGASEIQLFSESAKYSAIGGLPSTNLQLRFNVSHQSIGQIVTPEPNSKNMTRPARDPELTPDRGTALEGLK